MGNLCMNMDRTSGFDFTASARNNAEDVRRVLDEFRAAALVAGLDDLCGSAELVLAEVLNNVVEHALAGMGGRGSFGFSCHGDAHQLAISVTDNGRAMPGGQVPGGALPDVDTPMESGDIDALPEGGFGWALVHALVHDLHYARKNGVNTLNMTIIGESTGQTA